jgi:hypothetical protein
MPAWTSANFNCEKNPNPERESRCYVLSKTMPRPNSAEAAIQFYNRGDGGFRLNTPPNLVLELNSQKRMKEHKKGCNDKNRAS